MSEEGVQALIWFYLNKALPNTTLSDEWEDYKAETTDQTTRLGYARDLRDAGLLQQVALGARWYTVVACAQALVNDGVARVAASNESYFSVTEED